MISIILVNYHCEEDILEAVTSLKESSIPENIERKIIVVDNDVPSDLKEIPGVEILRPGKNLGFTGGNNLAIKHLQADLYLLLNPDTKVDKNFLVELIKPFLVTAGYKHWTKDKEVGLASPKIYFYPGFEFHKDRYKKPDQGQVIWYAGGEIDWDNVVCRHKQIDEVDLEKEKRGELKGVKLSLYSEDFAHTGFCTGCCLLFSKAVLDKIGPLDDKLFFSWEDVDFSVRAQKAGFETVYVPGSVVWHKNANTSGGAGSPIQDFYQTRNRLIFAFKYASLKVKVLLFWQLLKTANLNRLKAIFSSLVP